MKDLERWCNVQEQILMVGRCTHTEPEDPGEDGLEAAMAALETADPQPERFRPIAAH